LFRDEDFAGLYCRDNGRPSVPPSLLATALVLQAYAGVSDDEAKQSADYDLRWKVALGIELDVRPFAKSTLQEFRAQLILNAQTPPAFCAPRRSAAAAVNLIPPVASGALAITSLQQSSMSCNAGVVFNGGRPEPHP
jgi:Transposase domain (DUF772)